MSRFRRIPFFRPALVGALALALGVAACGRKGPLEPPPSAAIEPAPATAEAPPDALAQTSPRPPGRPNEAVVRAAPAAKERSLLDWLID